MPRESASLRHQVEDFLRKAIASGQFQAGQKLIEPFGVNSRQR